MRRPSRLISIATLLAVFWSAMWPLVAHAGPPAATQVAGHCERAGDPAGETTKEPVRGAGSGPHCPFCVPLANVAPSTPPQLEADAPVFVAAGGPVAAAPVHVAPHRRPPGRGPPVLP